MVSLAYVCYARLLWLPLRGLLLLWFDCRVHGSSQEKEEKSKTQGKGEKRTPDLI
jgi:hypothetical protein